MESSHKLKPTAIFPVKISITNTSSYRTFLKRKPKNLREVEINNASFLIDLKYHHETTPALLKIFKSIKYAHKFGLNRPTFRYRAIDKPKFIYFAKRMSQSRSIIIEDNNKPLNNKFLGLTESWLRYMKKVTSCSYLPCMPLIHSSREWSKPLSWKFPHYLQHQISLKNLTLDFRNPEMSLLQDLFLKKYPITLQRLSLRGLHFTRRLSTSFDRFKNLKHLDLHFDSHPLIKNVNANLICNLPENLQSLSLSWPSRFTEGLISTFPTIKTLKNLTQLKLSSVQVQGGKENPLMILDYFHDCPIQDLSLIFTIRSSQHLAPLTPFLKKVSNLKSFKLKIASYGTDFDDFEIKEILQVIDNLPMLKNLSFADKIKRKKHNYPHLHSIFTKIFTKPIPLESFKIQIKSIDNASQDFLYMIESLKPLAPTLKKLILGLGEHRPRKGEFETVLSFIRSLENIRSLRLSSFSIPTKQSFIELAQIVEKMPYLKNLGIGDVNAAVTKPRFMEIVEVILKKRGLEKFDCKVSRDFIRVLETKKKASKINLTEVRKKNCWLVKWPKIRIFKEN